MPYAERILRKASTDILPRSCTSSLRKARPREGRFFESTCGGVNTFSSPLLAENVKKDLTVIEKLKVRRFFWKNSLRKMLVLNILVVLIYT